MKNLYSTQNTKKQIYFYFLQIVLLFGVVFSANAQLRVPFTQRTSQYSPSRSVYNIKGDFAMVGNTNLTLQSYSNDGTNDNPMVYVDVDGDSNTFNSSSANLTLSTENGALPSCSRIIYAGLYWTGRSSNSNPSNDIFTVTKNNVTKTFNKRVISLKGPQSSTYTQFTAAASDIYYPTTSDGYMYSAYAEVTDYVRNNGLGNYFAADIALVEGNGGGTGFYGGWSLVVVYENSKMKYRDVTIFDGHAYVAGSVTADFEIPVSGFNTVQSGPVNMKLGLMAGEGDRGISGDYFQIRNHTNTNWVTLNHSGNATNNFFNSSIATGGNTRNPNLLNNTGLDISVFNIPNAGNAVMTNNQTSTRFRYGTTQDTYVIFAAVMSVDAYIPDVENILSPTAINNVPVTSPPYTVLPGQEMTFNVTIKNLGTEPINNYKLVIPIPFNASYVAGSAVGSVFFTPLPTPNTITFNPSLGATGSIVWDFGTLPLPADPNTLLGALSFKLRATTDCSILSNPNCLAPISVNGSSSGVGGITGVSFNDKQFIKGYSQNGSCLGEPVSQPLNVDINATNYVNTNCQNTPIVRNFNFCNSSTTVAVSQIAPNFPIGSLFYNQYPVTQSAIQYTASNPFPLVSGSTVTYYAVPPNTSGCFFPFTISKCGVINAINDNYSNINCTTTGLIGNVISNDLLNNVPVPLNLVTFTLLTGSNPNISFDSSGNVTVTSGIAAGTYTFTYRICENANASNCDTATITINVTDTTAPVIATLPAPSTISCPATPSFATATATDTCGSATLSFVDVVTNGTCSGSYSVTRTWTATDTSGNTSTASQTINVTDTTAPVIAALPAPSTISCPATPSFATATATDACGSTFTLTFNDVTTNGQCSGSYSVTRTWTATDACGNASTASQTINVTDTTAPVIAALPAPSTISCPATPSFATA
ncbi:HYR-like domain-containing protein, partial [Flavobacterium koreense]